MTRNWKFSLCMVSGICVGIKEKERAREGVVLLLKIIFGTNLWGVNGAGKVRNEKKLKNNCTVQGSKRVG